MKENFYEENVISNGSKCKYFLHTRSNKGIAKTHLAKLYCVNKQDLSIRYFYLLNSVYLLFKLRETAGRRSLCMYPRKKEGFKLLKMKIHKTL